MFCRNCGKQIPDQAIMCVSCGCPPNAGKKFCQNCGAETNPSAEVCIKCGVKLATIAPRGMKSELEQNAKPGKLIAIGGMRIGAGACNILAGIIFCWLLLPIIMIPLGIVEIISGANLLKEFPTRISRPIVIPILEIVAIVTLAGWISVVVGILSIVFLKDPKVKKYLQCLPMK